MVPPIGIKSQALVTLNQTAYGPRQSRPQPCSERRRHLINTLRNSNPEEENHPKTIGATLIGAN